MRLKLPEYFLVAFPEYKQNFKDKTFLHWSSHFEDSFNKSSFLVKLNLQILSESCVILKLIKKIVRKGVCYSIDAIFGTSIKMKVNQKLLR
jgi:hypothetical protein